MMVSSLCNRLAQPPGLLLDTMQQRSMRAWELPSKGEPVFIDIRTAIPPPHQKELLRRPLLHSRLAMTTQGHIHQAIVTVESGTSQRDFLVSSIIGDTTLPVNSYIEQVSGLRWFGPIIVMQCGLRLARGSVMSFVQSPEIKAKAFEAIVNANEHPVPEQLFPNAANHVEQLYAQRVWYALRASSRRHEGGTDNWLKTYPKKQLKAKKWLKLAWINRRGHSSSQNKYSVATDVEDGCTPSIGDKTAAGRGVSVIWRTSADFGGQPHTPTALIGPPNLQRWVKSHGPTRAYR
ncbi:hypothetical protein FA95DRAFT_1575813 [Auriscalpium vulgare]|uniref:Uncharacterized protein n=1 Tax=Auriscalpium vulgare TaxID=40419 RepID=A0ACB8REL2_9AGAM|nr:hypothetical protein FA95DRAFT_1575813 [Auriscalpium vulgare]